VEGGETGGVAVSAGDGVEGVCGVFVGGVSFVDGTLREGSLIGREGEEEE
jgi:hypothetical protein